MMAVGVGLTDGVTVEDTTELLEAGVTTDDELDSTTEEELELTAAALLEDDEETAALDAGVVDAAEDEGLELATEEGELLGLGVTIEELDVDTTVEL